MSRPERGGWLEAAERVLRPLLRSPRLRANLDLVLSHIDPQSAPGLVRTALWTEPGLTLSLLGALPDALNAGIGALRELAAQAAAQPPALVREAGGALLSRVDAEVAGEAAATLVGVLLPGPGAGGAAALALRFCGAFAAELERRLTQDPELGQAARQLAEGLQQALERHPTLARELLWPLRLLLDHPAVVAGGQPGGPDHG